MNNPKTFTTNSPEETVELAAKLGASLHKGDFVALIGELGSGKTVFVKGLAKGLGVTDYLHVNSPSFVVIKEYHGKTNLYHFDVYRLEAESFCETIDYEQYFYNDGVTVVEWADKIKDILPANYLEVAIEHAGDSKRKLTFRTVGETLQANLEKSKGKTKKEKLKE